MEQTRLSTNSLIVKLGGSIGLILLFVIVALIAALTFVRQQAAATDLLDIAGSQPMLTQRMSQLSLLVGSGERDLVLGADEQTVEQALAVASEQFDSGLNRLIGSASSDAQIQQQLTTVLEPLWQPFREDIAVVLNSGDNTEVRRAVNNIIASSDQLLLESERAIDLIAEQADRQQRAMTIFMVVIVLLTLAAAAVAVAVMRQITTQTLALNQALDEIEAGNINARAAVVSNDELGVVATRFNQLQERASMLIQTEEQRDQLQTSIMQLLEEVSTVAEGDLTVEAEVKADITGAIADSFNFMIEQLREVIGQVRDATLQVSSSANQIQTTAEHLALGSETQAQQIVDTSAAIDEMTISIQQVSENAALSAQVGEQARVSALEGSQAVHNTIEGMNRIRSQVQDTTKRIRRLGESSQRIGDIVELIDDIADRTSILALNASIQASIAGEAGRSFAVVAEEVERLADRAAEATQQISILIRNIQSEINEVIGAMETTNQEVFEGSQLANQAGRQLTEIETVSQQLNELIQQISLASKQQARGSETIAYSMNDIADVTQQTAAGTKQATVSIGNLARLADDLRSSVATFKLPSANGHSA